MKIYKGFCASPGLVLGQVSRLEHHVETTTVGPFKPSRELQLLTDAIRTAQDELESMADRAAPSEQAIFQFQSTSGKASEVIIGFFRNHSKRKSLPGNKILTRHMSPVHRSPLI